NGSTDVITVANGDTIKGVDVLSSSAGNTAGILISASATGTTTIDTVHVTFNQAADGLKLSGPAGTASVTWTNGSITSLNANGGVAVDDSIGSSGSIALSNVQIVITDPGSTNARAVSINAQGATSVV